MTAVGGRPRDHGDVDALVADRYLDDLLASGDRRADDAPADASLRPELRAAARVLRRSLVRVHPSFLFEERLAARLTELAGVQARTAAVDVVGSAGALIPFARSGSALDTADPLLRAILAGDLDPADASVLDADPRGAAVRRPLLVGGAITSAAISLVGVAWVAWRATRSGDRAPATAMGRAARTAHLRRAAATGARPAAAGLSGSGFGGTA